MSWSPEIQPLSYFLICKDKCSVDSTLLMEYVPTLKSQSWTPSHPAGSEKVLHCGTWLFRHLCCRVGEVCGWFVLGMWGGRIIDFWVYDQSPSVSPIQYPWVLQWEREAVGRGFPKVHSFYSVYWLQDLVQSDWGAFFWKHIHPYINLGLIVSNVYHNIWMFLFGNYCFLLFIYELNHIWNVMVYVGFVSAKTYACTYCSCVNRFVEFSSATHMFQTKHVWD